MLEVKNKMYPVSSFMSVETFQEPCYVEVSEDKFREMVLKADFKKRYQKHKQV